MKPAPKSPEFDRFTSALRHILSVPKSEIVKAEQEGKKARRTKRASSGHASRDAG
jgi:hypothetical protein